MFLFVGGVPFPCTAVTVAVPLLTASRATIWLTARIRFYPIQDPSPCSRHAPLTPSITRPPKTTTSVHGSSSVRLSLRSLARPSPPLPRPPADSASQSCVPVPRAAEEAAVLSPAVNAVVGGSSSSTYTKVRNLSEKTCRAPRAQTPRGNSRAHRFSTTNWTRVLRDRRWTSSRLWEEWRSGWNKGKGNVGVQGSVEGNQGNRCRQTNIVISKLLFNLARETSLRSNHHRTNIFVNV